MFSTMKFSISLDQRTFLNKKGYVPFFHLLSSLELKILNEGIDQALKQDQGNGRDLWRLSDSVKKIVFSKRLVDLVYQLVEKKPLRLAFDQYISDSASVLENRSSVSPLVGSLLIVLNGNESVGEGGGYFILPAADVTLEDFQFSPEQRFLLIGYGNIYSQYLYQPLDPHVHFLKKLGYVFGDRLNNALHPILLR